MDNVEQILEVLRVHQGADLFPALVGVLTEDLAQGFVLLQITIDVFQPLRYGDTIGQERPVEFRLDLGIDHGAPGLDLHHLLGQQLQQHLLQLVPDQGLGQKGRKSRLH